MECFYSDYDILSQPTSLNNEEEIQKYKLKYKERLMEYQNSLSKYLLPKQEDDSKGPIFSNNSDKIIRPLVLNSKHLHNIPDMLIVTNTNCRDNIINRV